jgi:hypothetical protein
MLQITRDATPVSAVLPGVPARLASVVDAALQTDPNKRPPDAGALLGELLSVRG